jgi:hypothetical protein
LQKNDILLKVTSFRNHKLLLCYWLQWRCHQEKGTNQDKGARKGQFLSRQSSKSGFVAQAVHATQNDVDKSVLSILQEQKHKNDSHSSVKSLSYVSSEVPVKVSKFSGFL